MSGKKHYFICLLSTRAGEQKITVTSRKQWDMVKSMVKSVLLDKECYWSAVEEFPFFLQDLLIRAYSNIRWNFIYLFLIIMCRYLEKKLSVSKVIFIFDRNIWKKMLWSLVGNSSKQQNCLYYSLFHCWYFTFPIPSFLIIWTDSKSW